SRRGLPCARIRGTEHGHRRNPERDGDVLRSRIVADEDRRPPQERREILPSGLGRDRGRALHPRAARLGERLLTGTPDPHDVGDVMERVHDRGKALRNPGLGLPGPGGQADNEWPLTEPGTTYPAVDSRLDVR